MPIQEEMGGIVVFNIISIEYLVDFAKKYISMVDHGLLKIRPYMSHKRLKNKRPNYPHGLHTW